MPQTKEHCAKIVADRNARERSARHAVYVATLVKMEKEVVNTKNAPQQSRVYIGSSCHRKKKN